jgi:Fe-S oxidoreductase
VNYFSQSPWFGPVLKWLGGIAQQRRVPKFAQETFVAWFRRRAIGNANGTPVILWADTFNNHFHPEVAQAAVEVLEREGFCVRVPSGSLCCGRPFYDFGMLDEAKGNLQEILERLRPAIRAGTPIVVLEPSCLAVFRDELPGLFPNDEDAKRLTKQSLLLSEFLVRKVKDYTPPQLAGRAIVQAHCHHRSVLGFAEEQEIMKRLGLQVETPEHGCCGMAGSFGFEPGDHYEVSSACGERNLLPAVRAADSQTLIIADGFSCREQIAQSTDRRAVHLAQVLARGYQNDGRPAQAIQSPTGLRRSTTEPVLVAAGITLAACAALLWLGNKRRLT